MDIEKLINTITSPKVITSALIIIGAIALWQVAKRLLSRFISRQPIKDRIDGRKETNIKLLMNLLKYTVIVVTTITVLQINGINVSSLIAGLGIASAIAGLALQDALKDIIMGANIISDSFFVIGDVVKYGSTEGQVISFSIKTTKIRDIYTNDVITICNRNISEIKRVSEQFDIDIPLSYGDDPKKIDSVLEEACEAALEIDEINDCKYLGANSFDDSSVAYKLRVFCRPEYKPAVRREVLGIVRDHLGRNHLEIPFPQLDVHECRQSAKVF